MGGGGGGGGPGPVIAAPAAPTIDYAAIAADEAKQQIAKAKGSAATLFSNQGVAADGSATLNAPGSDQTKKMMLGT